MLLDSPSAFGGTYDEAASNDDRAWPQRLTDNVVLLAGVGRTPAGSAMYSGHSVTDPAVCAFFGMWVDPRFRRNGVSGRLWFAQWWPWPGQPTNDA